MFMEPKCLIDFFPCNIFPGTDVLVEASFHSVNIRVIISYVQCPCWLLWWSLRWQCSMGVNIFDWDGSSDVLSGALSELFFRIIKFKPQTIYSLFKLNPPSYSYPIWKLFIIGLFSENYLNKSLSDNQTSCGWSYAKLIFSFRKIQI